MGRWNGTAKFKVSSSKALTLPLSHRRGKIKQPCTLFMAGLFY